MSYTKHNYQKGDQLLASQLNEMDEQIALNEAATEEIKTSVDILEPSAANTDVGKFLKVKEVNGGKVIKYDFDFPPEPTEAQVSSAVNTWLNENVAQETGYVLDRSLSVSSAAAPADLTGALFDAVDVNVITFIEGRRIVNSGTTIDLNNFNSNASWKYAIVDCQPGDTFTINSVGGSTYRAWAFVSSDNTTILSKAADGAACTNTVVVAPDNAAKLVINDTIAAGTVCYKGSLISEKYNELKNERERIDKIIQRDFYEITGLYRPSVMTKGFLWDSSGVLISNSNFYITPLFDVEHGISIKVEGVSHPGSTVYYAFFDENRVFVSSVKAPQDSSTFYIPLEARYVSFSVHNDDYNSFNFVIIAPIVTKKEYKNVDYPYSFDRFVNKDFVEIGNPDAGFVETDKIVMSDVVHIYAGDILTVTTAYSFNIYDASSFKQLVSNRRTFLAVRESASAIVRFKNDNGEDVSSEEIIKNAIAYTTINFHSSRNNLTRFNLNECYADNTDMFWCWWFYPQVISFKKVRNCLYWGFTQSDGGSGIGCKNLSTGVVTKTVLKRFNADIHDSTCVFVKNDGTVICAYPGGHNEDRQIHIRISEKKESIERFSQDRPLDCGDVVSYCSIVFSGGKYVMGYRLKASSWAIRLSDDCITWGEERIFVQTSAQYYCLFRPTTSNGIIRVVMYPNPSMSIHDIRMGFYDVINDKILDADGVTILGTDSIPYDSFTTIIPKDPNYSMQRLLDVAITPIERALVLYCPFTDDDSEYRLYDNGMITNICAGGKSVWYPKSQLGCAFVGTDKIISSREQDNVDTIELYNYNDGQITLNKTIYSEAIGDNTIRNAWPIVDINNNYIMWGRGYFNRGQYKDFNMDAVIYDVNE